MSEAKSKGRITVLVVLVATLGLAAGRVAIDVMAMPTSLLAVKDQTLAQLIDAERPPFLDLATSFAQATGVESRPVEAGALSRCLEEGSPEACEDAVVRLERADPMSGELPLLAFLRVGDRTVSEAIEQSCEFAPRENWLALNRILVSGEGLDGISSEAKACLDADADAVLAHHSSFRTAASFYVRAPSLRPLLAEAAARGGRSGERFVEELSRVTSIDGAR